VVRRSNSGLDKIEYRRLNAINSFSIYSASCNDPPTVGRGTFSLTSATSSALSFYSRKYSRTGNH